MIKKVDLLEAVLKNVIIIILIRVMKDCGKSVLNPTVRLTRPALHISVLLTVENIRN